MYNLLIIEDDATIREALEYNLRAGGFATSVAADGANGLKKALSENPDVILLDRLLPGMDGIEVCRRLREAGRESRIIMITALGTETDKIRGLDVGADDYVTKPFSFDELLARIKAQLRRSQPAPERTKLLTFGDIELDDIRHELKVKDLTVKVRPKEWQLLVILAQNPGALFSRRELADKVWGMDFVGSSRTIDVHIRRLREKVEALSAYNFIKTVHGLGYRFDLKEKTGP